MKSKFLNFSRLFVSEYNLSPSFKDCRERTRKAIGSCVMLQLNTESVGCMFCHVLFSVVKT
jgi:hypothetical protein